MAQLRCRILPLKIETGGFQNVKDTNTGQYRKLKSRKEYVILVKMTALKMKYTLYVTVNLIGY